MLDAKQMAPSRSSIPTVGLLVSGKPPRPRPTTEQPAIVCPGLFDLNSKCLKYVTTVSFFWTFFSLALYANYQKYS